MAGVVVVFDFDKTIIDVDSDNWAVDELGATELFNQLLPTMPWNTMMDTMMRELHAQGKTIEDVEEVLSRTPIHPRVVPAIKSAHALGCDLRIVSDANLFFIETMLKQLGIRHCFSEINSNPSFVNDEGRLRIFPFHDFHSSSHGCERCPPNMCKSLIVERIQASLAKEGNKRMVYLGDGVGDFCPSLRLKEGDIMMPRKDYPVWDLICKNRKLLKAEVFEWIDGEDLENVLLQLIDKIYYEESNNQNANSLLLDCKFELPMATHENFPQALPVPH